MVVSLNNKEIILTKNDIKHFNKFIYPHIPKETDAVPNSLSIIPLKIIMPPLSSYEAPVLSNSIYFFYRTALFIEITN